MDVAQNLQGLSYEVCSTNIGTNFHIRITYSCFWDMCHYIPVACCYVTRIYEIRASILGTFELKKLPKIGIFISLCDNSAHKRADNLVGLLTIVCKCGNRIKFVIFFRTGREGQSNV